MISVIFFWIITGCSTNGVSAMVTITRDTNDLIQFSSCTRNMRNFCNNLNADPYGNDARLCSCQCRPNYVMYADPFVNRRFKYEPGKSGCIWHGHNHEGTRKITLCNVNREMVVRQCHDMMRVEVLRPVHILSRTFP